VFGLIYILPTLHENMARVMVKNRALAVFLLAILLIVFVAVAYYSTNKISGRAVLGENETACQDDWRVCSDGSYVFRNPDANCEFDPCPSGDFESCSGLGEEDCAANELCEPVYFFAGCNDDVCNSPKTFDKCIAR